MSDCCSSTPETHPGRHPCPVCGNTCREVSTTTILHHIKEPWNWKTTDQGYYFCNTPNCDVAYCGEDNSVIGKSELRTKIGLKENSTEALICYCFGVTSAEANAGTRAFVTQKTKERLCACEIRNPSGRCCLKDFPG